MSTHIHTHTHTHTGLVILPLVYFFDGAVELHRRPTWTSLVVLQALQASQGKGLHTHTHTHTHIHTLKQEKITHTYLLTHTYIPHKIHT
jgi:hypothetical protein